MMKRTLIFILSCFCLIGCSKREETIYVLPPNYTGYIVVIHGQPNGEKEIYENNKRVYRIPNSGILKTQFEADYGWSEFPEFYYGEIVPAKKIPYKYDLKDVPTNEVVSYGGSTGTANKNLEGTEAVKFTIYYVGNREQVNMAMQTADTLNYAKLAE